MGGRLTAPAHAYGGVSLQEYAGAKVGFVGNSDFQLTQSDLEAPVERDPAFCLEDNKHGDQCGARPVKGETLCAGHKRAAEKLS